MSEQYSIVKDLGYVKVINSVDLQIFMTKKSMSEFDRLNLHFYMKVSYNEEDLLYATEVYWKPTIWRDIPDNLSYFGRGYGTSK